MVEWESQEELASYPGSRGRMAVQPVHMCLANCLPRYKLGRAPNGLAVKTFSDC